MFIAHCAIEFIVLWVFQLRRRNRLSGRLRNGRASDVVLRESSSFGQWGQELFFQLAPLRTRSNDIALFHMAEAFD